MFHVQTMDANNVFLLLYRQPLFVIFVVTYCEEHLLAYAKIIKYLLPHTFKIKQTKHMLTIKAQIAKILVNKIKRTLRSCFLFSRLE